MLGEQTISIIKSTAPVLAEHGETLTRHFYQRMFSHNPEVLPFFNPAHQKSGAQQKALASAITAYAANVDNLEALGTAVELIAQKHASLQVKPEHYPIVGENLLASIREVLGEAASDDIIDAWGQAYGVLAEILIDREEKIYQQQQADGGWNGFKSFKIDRIDTESDIVKSFYLVPEDGAKLPLYRPGQYITVRVPAQEGGTTMRNYSLSNKPGEEYFRISVKREDAGGEAPKGYVSNLLHNEYKAGDTLEVAAPCGEFFLDTEMAAQEDRPLVLLAGGIGITPLLSILWAALDVNPERKILFVHAVKNKKVQGFRAVLDALAGAQENLEVVHLYEEGAEAENGEKSGVLDEQLMAALISNPQGREYYFCGPKPFMSKIYRQLQTWNVPDEHIHFEFFGPLQELKGEIAQG